MTKRTLVILIFLLVVLGTVAYLSDKGQGERRVSASTKLFEGIDVSKIAQIELVRGEDSIELELKDGIWTVPSRWNYPADGGKVKSLVLYDILALEVSQAIPVSEKGMRKLGVAEESIKKGRARVRFMDSEGNELGGLYLGELRKNKGEGSPIPIGQYVRRLGQDSVYLISKPVEFVTTVGNWLDSQLANVTAKNIRNIRQTVLGENGEKVDFELISDLSDKEPKLQLKNPVGDGKEVNDSALTQAKSALANLQFSDVLASDSEESNGLKFDRKSEFSLSNALIYTVLTAEKKEKFYTKFSVAYDAALASKIRERIEVEIEEAAASEEKEGAAEEKQEKIKARIEAELSTVEDAEKLNSGHAPWIYVLPDYAGKKFRKSREELVKAKEEPKPKPEAAGEAS